jgi:hypothetical protein
MVNDTVRSYQNAMRFDPPDDRYMRVKAQARKLLQRFVSEIEAEELTRHVNGIKSAA